MYIYAYTYIHLHTPMCVYIHLYIHAAEPHNGISPADAISKIIKSLKNLSRNSNSEDIKSHSVKELINSIKL